MALVPRGAVRTACGSADPGCGTVRVARSDVLVTASRCAGRCGGRSLCPGVGALPVARTSYLDHEGRLVVGEHPKGELAVPGGGVACLGQGRRHGRAARLAGGALLRAGEPERVRTRAGGSGLGDGRDHRGLRVVMRAVRREDVVVSDHPLGEPPAEVVARAVVLDLEDRAVEGRVTATPAQLSDG